MGSDSLYGLLFVRCRRAQGHTVGGGGPPWFLRGTVLFPPWGLCWLSHCPAGDIGIQAAWNRRANVERFALTLEFCIIKYKI